MAFSIKNWVNGSGGGTPVDETSLEDMETRLAGYTDAEVAAEETRAKAAETAKASKTELGTESTAREGAVSTEKSRAESAEALKLAKASNLSDLASAPTARTNLGLGTAATQASSAFDASGAAAAEQTRAEAAEALIKASLGSAFTPEQFGAKGDLKYVVDAGITNASKVLTSVTAAFTAADVGKTINIRGAGLSENKGMLTTTIAAVTNGTTVELAVASAATGTNKVAIYGTDDTEAIQKAINEAFAAGVASGSNFAEVKLTGKYMVAKAPTKGGTTKGNAQITLPYVEPKKSKFILSLKCPGRGAPLLHWHQVGPAIAGATLFSPLIAAAADGEWSVPSVIGGPTVLASDEGTLGFSNMLFEVDGALTILMPRRPNHMGMDLGLVGQCDIGSLAVIANATAVELKEDVDGNSFAANGEGIRMPKSGNNDLAKIETLSLEGIPFGVGFGEHAHIERLAAIYCKTTVFVGPIGSVPTHGAYVGYWSQEACRNCLETSASAGGKYPITVSRMDVEDTAGLSTDFIDANNALRGTLHWAQNESRAPVKSGAEHLKITDDNNTA